MNRRDVVLRFVHPKVALIKAVTVNGKLWTLKGLAGTVAVTAPY